MKTDADQRVRISPVLCDAARESFAEGEAMSGFIARGLVSRDAAHASGRYVKTATVGGKQELRVKDACMKATIGK